MALIIVLVKFLILITFCDAMTMKQLRNTGKMMRKSCQPKNNVEDEKIDGIGDGVFIEEKEVMCYIACIMKMANAIKNNKLSYDAAIKQIDLLLPDEMKEPAKSALTACRKIMEQYKDICEASFHITKCIYNENPEIGYVIPYLEVQATTDDLGEVEFHLIRGDSGSKTLHSNWFPTTRTLLLLLGESGGI